MNDSLKWIKKGEWEGKKEEITYNDRLAQIDSLMTEWRTDWRAEWLTDWLTDWVVRCNNDKLHSLTSYFVITFLTKCKINQFSSNWRQYSVCVNPVYSSFKQPNKVKRKTLSELVAKDKCLGLNHYQGGSWSSWFIHGILVSSIFLLVLFFPSDMDS